MVAVVAQNDAKKVRAKLHKDLPMGRAGSEPPRMHDDHADERVELLIDEMHRGGGSLASLVALKVDFDQRWVLLADDDCALLHSKYAEGMTSKDIAKQRGRGESPGTIDDGDRDGSPQGE